HRGRGDSRKLRPLPRRSPRCRRVRRHRDPRRVVDRRRTSPRRRARPRARAVRAADAARRARAARDRACPRRPPAARVYAVRRTVVCVFAAATAGESRHGRHDRARDRRARTRPRDMIWTRAEGCRVTLADGRELLDLSGGFGVAALGHRNPRILEAWRAQEVVHALGDLADAEVTVRFRDALPWAAKLGVTGEDAVEIALRTAHLANGRAGIVAFDGAYH